MEIPNGSLIEGPLQVGNLQLYTLPIEHHLDSWNASWEQVIDGIKAFPLIVPEYFPPEYRHLRYSSNPAISLAVSSYNDSNYLFDRVAEWCLEENKEVWVLDPAYDETAIALRSAGWFTALAHGANAGLNPLLSRRQFLKGILVLAAGLSPATEVVLEESFRRTVVSENIRHLGQQVPQDTNALLIYPPAHWSSIKDRIIDPESNRLFGFYKNFKDNPAFKNLFLARNYVPSGNKWEQKQVVALI